MPIYKSPHIKPIKDHLVVNLYYENISEYYAVVQLLFLLEVELQNLHADHDNTLQNPNEYYVIVELVILDEELLNLHGDHNNTTI